MKHFRRFDLLFVVYVAICLGTVGFDFYKDYSSGQLYGHPWFVEPTGWLLKGAGTSDPVLLVILRLITIVLGVVFGAGYIPAYLALFVLIIGLMLMLWLLSGAWWLATVSPTGGVVVTLAGAAIVIGIIKAVRASAARERLRAKLARCSACGADKSQIEIYDRQVHSYYPSTRTETRQLTHHNTEGEETGYTEYDVEVPDERTYVILYKKCKQCSHTWTTQD